MTRQCATIGCRNTAQPGQTICMSCEIASWAREEAAVTVEEPLQTETTEKEDEDYDHH